MLLPPCSTQDMATPQDQFPLETCLSLVPADSNDSRSPAPSPAHHPTKRPRPHHLMLSQPSGNEMELMSDMSVSQEAVSQGISQSRSQGEPSSCCRETEATAGAFASASSLLEAVI